jgi:outer membrane immunogenic protein
VGYNYQVGNAFVAGLEADIQGATIRGRGSFTGAGAGFTTFGRTTFTDSVSSAVEHEKRVDWLGTVRGRIGYLATPTLLAFATGGLAYGGVTANSHISQFWGGDDLVFELHSPGGVGAFSDTRVGWTVGGGLEWMFMPNWSVKGEYLYYDLGTATWNSDPVYTVANHFQTSTSVANSLIAQSTTRFDGHIARAGVNYHFGWGARR